MQEPSTQAVRLQSTERLLRAQSRLVLLNLLCSFASDTKSEAYRIILMQDARPLDHINE